MRIIIAADSFKGSLPAHQVVSHLAAGLKAAWPAAEMVELPLADGGEGLVASLVRAIQGTVIQHRVTGPLGELEIAQFGWLADRRLAIIEMAAASGLELVPVELRNPWITTTYGTGQLIRAALDMGARRLVIGLGGSATNDGGAGMAQALGVKLLDSSGNAIGPGAAGLTTLNVIDTSTLDPRLARIELLAACDVDNPLLGPTGAAAVYGPQKGAGAEDIHGLEAALRHFANLVEAQCRIDAQAPCSRQAEASLYRHVPGAGAAGGLGFGLLAFCNARLVPGAELVMGELGARRQFSGADLVITGEGRIDASTLHGKLPAAVAKLAQQEGTPVIAVCGILDLSLSRLRDAGFAAAFSLTGNDRTVAEARANAGRLLKALGHRIGSDLRSGRLKLGADGPPSTESRCR